MNIAVLNGAVLNGRPGRSAAPPDRGAGPSAFAVSVEDLAGALFSIAVEDLAAGPLFSSIAVADLLESGPAPASISVESL